MTNKFMTRKRFGEIVLNSFKKEHDVMVDAKNIPERIQNGEIKDSHQISEPQAIYALFAYIDSLGGDREVSNILIGRISDETKKQKSIVQGLSNKTEDYKNFW